MMILIRMQLSYTLSVSGFLGLAGETGGTQFTQGRENGTWTTQSPQLSKRTILGNQNAVASKHCVEFK